MYIAITFQYFPFGDFWLKISVSTNIRFWRITFENSVHTDTVVRFHKILFVKELMHSPSCFRFFLKLILLLSNYFASILLNTRENRYKFIISLVSAAIKRKRNPKNFCTNYVLHFT